MFETRLCERCGGAFTPVRVKMNCCSPRCKSSLQALRKTEARIASQMRDCVICGMHFRGLRGAETCSTSCYWKSPRGLENKQRSYRKNSGRPEAKVKRRADKYLREYGITIEDYDAMFAAQGGRCAICSARPTRRLAVDHDHKTGAVRALLCHRCNPGLGLFTDDPNKLIAAADYIERHR